MVVGDNFILVGIGGVTNGGKSSLTAKLKSRFPQMKCLRQDDFFLKPDDPRHVWVRGSTFHCQNWEIPEALDFVMLKQKLKELAEQGENSPFRLILLEGHLLFVEPEIVRLSDLKYFFTLTKEQCWERRKDRVYDPPDPPGYFDKVVFPEYLKHKKFVEDTIRNVQYVDGSGDPDKIFTDTVNDINRILNIQ